LPFFFYVEVGIEIMWVGWLLKNMFGGQNEKVEKGGIGMEYGDDDDDEDDGSLQYGLERLGRAR
jgi:hypothetical protein